MQITQHALDGCLSDIIATGNQFDPAATWIGVATGINAQGLSTTMAMVSPASGQMSARVKLSPWNGPFHSLTGQSYDVGPNANFSPASSAEAQTLVAWFIADASVAGNLLGYGLILPNVVLADNTHQWNIVMKLALDSNGIWSLEMVGDG